MKKKSPNSELWKKWGVTTKGMSLADEAMPHMMKAVLIAGPELSKAVYDEATFQIFEYPKRKVVKGSLVKSWRAP